MTFIFTRFQGIGNYAFSPVIYAASASPPATTEQTITHAHNITISSHPHGHINGTHLAKHNHHHRPIYDLILFHHKYDTLTI